MISTKKRLALFEAMKRLSVAAVVVHDAKDGFARAQAWPEFSKAVKALKRVFK